MTSAALTRRGLKQSLGSQPEPEVHGSRALNRSHQTVRPATRTRPWPISCADVSFHIETESGGASTAFIRRKGPCGQTDGATQTESGPRDGLSCGYGLVFPASSARHLLCLALSPCLVHLRVLPRVWASLHQLGPGREAVGGGQQTSCEVSGRPEPPPAVGLGSVPSAPPSPAPVWGQDTGEGPRRWSVSPPHGWPVSPVSEQEAEEKGGPLFPSVSSREQELCDQGTCSENGNIWPSFQRFN